MKTDQNRGKIKTGGEQGSIIFMVFIAIMLFGALSFAVIQIMRTGTPEQISAEKAKIYAAEILDNARQYKEAIQYATLTNDCEAQDISFANPVQSGYAHSPAAPAACQIFHESQGNASYAAPPTDWLDAGQSGQTAYGQWLFTGQGCVYEVGTGGSDCATNSTTTNSDLIAVMPWVKREICVQINNHLGIENPGGNPPQADDPALNAAMTKFTGTFAEDFAIQSDTSDTTILSGVPSGCFEGAGTPPANSYHFYQVLIAR